MSATDTVVNQGMHCDLLYWFSKNDRGLRTQHAVGGGGSEKASEWDHKNRRKKRGSAPAHFLSVFFWLAAGVSVSRLHFHMRPKTKSEGSVTEADPTVDDDDGGCDCCGWSGRNEGGGRVKWGLVKKGDRISARRGCCRRSAFSWATASRMDG